MKSTSTLLKLCVVLCVFFFSTISPVQRFLSRPDGQVHASWSEHSGKTVKNDIDEVQQRIIFAWPVV